MKSFKDLKSVIAENRYMVKFEKGGSMKVREYEASSAMAAESKAKVDAKRMGMTVASVRLKEVEKKTKDSPAMDECTQIEEAHQEVSADFKITPSGKKVPVQRKQFKDMEDEKEVKEDVNKSDVPAYLRKKTGDKLTTQDLEKERTKNRSHPETIKKINGTQQESVEHIEEGTVETGKYSWGTMKTVHHGADFSIPLHPEHHQAIHALKHGQEHKFKDETGHHWIAKRDNDKVHFQSADLHGGMKTSVKHSDLKESTEEVNEQQVHRVSVTVTDPHHPATTMRNVKVEKRVKVKANDREHAIDSALHFYKKQGLKVHDHNYIGTVNESVKTTHENPLVTVHDMHGLHTGVEQIDEVLDMRHHTTGTGSIHVSHTHTSPSRVHSIGYTDAQKISNLKAGEKHEYKNANGHEKFTAHKQSDDSTKIHDDRGTHVATIKNKMGRYDGQVKESLDEAMDKQDQRLIQLARLGLVDKANVSKLRMAMDQLKSDKPLSVAQRSLLLNVLEELFGLVTGDDQVFMRLKRDVQTESADKDKDDKDVPFDGPYTKKPSATPGKHGSGYSTARHLARLALQKQQKKQGK